MFERLLCTHNHFIRLLRRGFVGLDVYNELPSDGEAE
jgi:hypothetical protein